MPPAPSNPLGPVISVHLRRTLVLLGVGVACSTAPALAQGAGDLARATPNPVGDLTAVPFQFNWSSGGDLGNSTMYNRNFQPFFNYNLPDAWTLGTPPGSWQTGKRPAGRSGGWRSAEESRR